MAKFQTVKGAAVDLGKDLGVVKFDAQGFYETNDPKAVEALKGHAFVSLVASEGSEPKAPKGGK